MVPLAVPAVVFFLQFVLIGAGKPAEYGRFGVFTNTALALGAAGLLGLGRARRLTAVHSAAITLMALLVGMHGARYLAGFCIDAGDNHSRIRLARAVASWDQDGSPAGAIAVLAEPAPYGCPPINFAKRQVLLLGSREEMTTEASAQVRALLQAVDQPLPETDGLEPMLELVRPVRDWPVPTPISWANKPFTVFRRAVLPREPV